MIVKKLLVPLINNKILQEAEYCYIAASAISEPAFDLLISKLSPKCKVDIVTGLDLPTHPNVLRKAMSKYMDRVTLRIYTRNTFHSNAYIFDLPFRKRVAFIGSSQFTMEGLKDTEELSYKIDNEKGVEEIKSWFRTYFEFAQDISEKMIQEYELIYPSIRQREIISRKEKKQFTDLAMSSFSWDKINFKNQYFKLEDYLTFENRKTLSNTSVVQIERAQVQNKFHELHKELEPYTNVLKVYVNHDAKEIASSVDAMFHEEHKVKSMWIAYGRGKEEAYRYQVKPQDLMSLQVILRQQEVGVCLTVGSPGRVKEDREFFRNEMKKEEYRKNYFDALKKLGKEYFIEVAGERKPADSFPDENLLWDFTSADHLQFYFLIGRSYAPSDPAISSAVIASTVKGEFDKLIVLYRLMKDSKFGA